jgi:hypothetical protein
MNPNQKKKKDKDTGPGHAETLDLHIDRRELGGPGRGGQEHAQERAVDRRAAGARQLDSQEDHRRRRRARPLPHRRGGDEQVARGAPVPVRVEQLEQCGAPRGLPQHFHVRRTCPDVVSSPSSLTKRSRL